MKPGQKLIGKDGREYEIQATWVQTWVEMEKTVGVDLVNIKTGSIKYIPYVRLIQLLETGKLKIVV